MKLKSVARAAAVSLALSASLAAQSKPVFQESFESGKIDANVWDQRVSGTATIAVEEVEGAHGKYALHVHYPDMAPRSYAFAVATHLPDSVQTHFFGRAYVKISSSFTPGHNVLIFAGEPGWPLSKFEEIGAYHKTWQPSYQENKSAAGQGRGEIPYHSDPEVPFDKWFLLEWEVNDDPATMTMWVDGQQITYTVAGEKVDMVKYIWPKGSTTASNLVGGFKEFGFGTRVWGNAATGFDVYYDDIAIGTSRVGPAK